VATRRDAALRYAQDEAGRVFRSALVGTSAVCQCYDQVGKVSALDVCRSIAMAPEAITPPNLGSLRGRESPSGLAGLASAGRMPSGVERLHGPS
jgi:hypothetical protein